MFGYQNDAVEWMNIREDDKITPGGFLCHEMGLGKTHIVCKHIKNSIERAPRTLLLTTKSTIGSWKDTLMFYSNFLFDIRIGTKCSLSPVRPVVVIATHNSVLKNEDWCTGQGFDRIVVDEAHVLRNRGKLFHKTLNVSKTVKFRWGVTATPFNNKDRDMLAYAMFLRPFEVGVKGEIFKHYFLRKLRSEVVVGGPKLEITKMVYDFETPEEQAMYDYVSKKIEIAQETARGHAVLTLILRMRQASIHPQLVLKSEKLWAKGLEWDPTKVTKLNKIIDLIKHDQSENKNTMVITHFEQELQLIKDRLVADDIPFRILNGKTSILKRRELEKKIDTSPAEVVLLQIQAGGVGISLPWIHHVINAAPDWNPFLEKQSIYRAYRINTEHDVLVTSMYLRNTIEIAMQLRQKEKLERSVEWTNDSIESISEYIAMPE